MILDLTEKPILDKAWRNYFPYVFVPNLQRRTDRRERMQNQLDEYEIDFEFVDAIHNDDGAMGLIQTMKALFNECLDNGMERILVLEDDCRFLVQPIGFHEIMSKCCADLEKFKWDCFYLGLQHPTYFTSWTTPNILPVMSHGYATHAVAYSKDAMEYIVASDFGTEVFDNFLVKHFQKYNTSYCSYPILATQEADYSDICNQHMDWAQYIEPIFNQKVFPILKDRFKTKTNI